MAEFSQKNTKKPTAARAARSAGSLQPGDLITFGYKLPPNTSPKIKVASARTRLALVVSNNSGNGVFVANTGNKLLSCFTLTDASPVIRKMVIDKLYNKRRLSNYYKITKSLVSILGKDKYRTYILNRLSNLKKVEM